MDESGKDSFEARAQAMYGKEWKRTGLYSLEPRDIPEGFEFSEIPEIKEAAELRAAAMFGTDWRKTAKLTSRFRDIHSVAKDNLSIQVWEPSEAPDDERTTFSIRCFKDKHYVNPTASLPGYSEFSADGVRVTDIYYEGGMPHDPQRGKPAITEYDECGGVKTEFFMWRGKSLESRAKAESSWDELESPALSGASGVSVKQTDKQIQK